MSAENNERAAKTSGTAWWALYIRLSREDGDQAESLSVIHQRLKLIRYVESMEEAAEYRLYVEM